MAYVSPDYPTGAVVIEGPPEGLVDTMGLPEETATRLHNILFNRGLFTYEDVIKNQRSLLGVIQEAFSMDVQKLQEAFFQYQNENAV